MKNCVHWIMENWWFQNCKTYDIIIGCIGLFTFDLKECKELIFQYTYQYSQKMKDVLKRIYDLKNCVVNCVVK